jgi:hypothetical protein
VSRGRLAAWVPWWTCTAATLAACGSEPAAHGGFDAGVRDAVVAPEASRSLDAAAEATMIDAGVGMVGVLGQTCAPPGALACAGNAQKLQLLCDASGHWVANGTCSGSQLCDSVPGQNAGTCQDQVPKCVGQQPGFEFCIPSGGPELDACGPDLVTITVVTVCPVACANGMCAPCEPGYEQCSGNQPQSCDPAGGGSYAWKNVGPPCAAGCTTTCATGVHACCL